MNFKAGYVMVMGLPNAGKSTLMNRLLQQKVSIVTHKAQTTRATITGVLNTPNMQAIMLDTPGYQERRDKLNKMIRESFKTLVPYTDVALIVIDPITMKLLEKEKTNNATTPFHNLIHMVNSMPVPKIIALNKWDKYPKNMFYQAATTLGEYIQYDELIPISATSQRAGNNMDTLAQLLEKYLPVGEKIYDAETISTNNEGFLASEFVREKIFQHTNEEIPYSTAVLTTSMDETNTVIHLNMDIMVKTNSQKGIIIGKNGQMLKRIGEEARLELEQLLGKRIYLELYVRVNERWDRDIESISGL